MTLQDDKLLKRVELENYLKLGRTKVALLIKEKDFPATIFYSLNKRRWRLKDVDKWIESRRDG